MTCKDNHMGVIEEIKQSLPKDSRIQDSEKMKFQPADIQVSILAKRSFHTFYHEFHG